MRPLVFIAFLFLSQASAAESFATPAAVREFTDGVMNRVATGDIEGGLKMIKPYTIVPAPEFEVMVGQASLQLPAITQRFGKSLGKELISDERIGESLERLIYLQKFERHALRWMFFLYQGKGGWVIDTFVFDDRIQDLFTHQ